MPKASSNNITVDDVDVRLFRGRFEDGTEFFLSDSRKYLIVLPRENMIGIRPNADEFEDHGALREALETLTGEEFGEERVAAEMAEEGFLIDGIARRDEVAECLQEAI